MPITLAHYLYTTVSDSEPQKEMIMQIQDLSQIFENKFDCYADMNDDSVVLAMTKETFIKVVSNILSDCERQPVSDNEQTESKPKCICYEQKEIGVAVYCSECENKLA